MSIHVVSTTDSKEAVDSINAVLAGESTVEKTKSESDKVGKEPKDETDTKESETLAQDDEETQSPETDESNEDDEVQAKDDSERPKKTNGFKKKIDKLIKRNADKDREIEMWKAQALKGQQPQATQEKPIVKVEATGKPKQDDYASHEEWVEAIADWKLEAREKEKELKARETQVKTEYQKQVSTFQEKVNEYKKSVDDFDDALSDVDDIPLGVGIQDGILSSDIGPEIMYELAKNRKELERINALSPLAAAREIGKIEARLAKTESSETKEIKKTTKAPAPITPVGSKGTASLTKSLSSPNLTQAEYEAIRRKQIAQRGA